MPANSSSTFSLLPPMFSTPLVAIVNRPVNGPSVQSNRPPTIPLTVRCPPKDRPKNPAPSATCPGRNVKLPALSCTAVPLLTWKEPELVKKLPVKPPKKSVPCCISTEPELLKVTLKKNVVPVPPVLRKVPAFWNSTVATGLLNGIEDAICRVLSLWISNTPPGIFTIATEPTTNASSEALIAPSPLQYTAPQLVMAAFSPKFLSVSPLMFRTPLEATFITAETVPPLVQVSVPETLIGAACREGCNAVSNPPLPTVIVPLQLN